MAAKELSDGIFEVQKSGKRFLGTKNAVPGSAVYGERLVEMEGDEYRIWDARRSKLGAMVLKKMKIPIKSDSRVLYLGAASGTTVSHVSDIVTDGLVYAVEFSPRTMRELIQLCDTRSNIVPILADANHPASYAHIVEQVDVVFQDVAQPNQAQIAAVNCEQFLKDEGHLLLSIKARSIDTVASPAKIFKEEVKKLEKEFDTKFEVLKKHDLAPFHEDHLGLIAQKIIR
ncbi:fibrillarin-like rRNA/tRNA 2'-O-methyltransferase [Methanococcoides methylutens]|uniref:Fibrillarin-like rRNA/tRNA 2'-O-methyltransferase n=1 Tax=Methanococcoides methylutens MM1 TaxID=1434104 RepID=A0A0E3X0R0_METMT|nr:fibrillarin-like rRNA/tRNA 2'-O-methyltransferase [Methanococcoides methylutens]AKB86125.1 Fibrillarin [Methanococcoides methylutens MM1]